MFIPRAQSHAQSLFLSPIVFGINLIHIFDEKKYGAAGNSIVFVGDSTPVTPFDRSKTKNANCLKSATFLATESVNSAPFRRGETKVQLFWQEKVQNSSPMLRCNFLARKGAKFIANFSATKVTSLPSVSPCISLSLSLSHRAHLTHNIGSASALPV